MAVFRASDGQRRHARAVAGRTCKHTVVYGGVRSGKTAVAIRAFCDWMSLNHEDSVFLFMAKGKVLLQAVVRRELSAWAAERGLQLGVEGEFLVIPSLCGAKPNKALLCVFGDSKNVPAGETVAARRLQGLTLQGAYVDEAANCPDDVRHWLYSRLSPPGARAVWVCNAEDGTHSFKTQLIDKIADGGMDGQIIRTSITDNPANGPDFYEQLEEEYPFEWQRARYIRGEWTDASGACYPGVTEPWPSDRGRLRDIPDGMMPTYLSAGVDWASKTVTHAVLVGATRVGSFVMDEWRHDARQQGPLTEDEQAERMFAWFARHGSIAVWVVDQTSKGLIHALGQIVAGEVVPSSWLVRDGVAKIGRLWNAERLFLTSHVPHLCEELRSYRWPEDADRRENVKPVKANDHGCDALRYWGERALMPGAAGRRGFQSSRGR